MWSHARTRLQRHRPGTCPLCGAPVRGRMPARDRMHAIGGLFSAARCQGCRVIFLHPQPDDDTLSAHYPSTYYSYGDDGGEPPRTRQQRRPIGALLWRWTGQLPMRVWDRLYDILRRASSAERETHTLITRAHGTGCCLDVGCGDGRFLDEQRARGWVTYGVDVAPDACDRARRKGHVVFCGDVTAAPFEPGAFELITVMHTLEHLRDPLAAMQTMSRLLSATGRIVIVTPNGDSWLSHVSSRWYWQLDAPRHLVILNPRALSLLARHAGLSVTRLYTRGDGIGIAYSALYFLNDLLPRSPYRFLLGRDRARVWNAFHLSYIRPGLDLLCVIADLFARGDNVCVHLAAPGVPAAGTVR